MSAVDRAATGEVHDEARLLLRPDQWHDNEKNQLLERAPRRTGARQGRLHLFDDRLIRRLRVEGGLVDREARVDYRSIEVDARQP